MTFRIAIDGPAGAGKSTLAQRLAQTLHMTYLDTGAMYRAVTLCVLRAGVDPNDEKAVERLLPKIQLSVSGSSISLCGEDVSDAVRSQAVTEAVSAIARYRSVRQRMVELQRSLSEGKEIILDGRDIGTVVFPDAEVKFFLTASAEERARRRLTDAKDTSGLRYSEILADIRRRDTLDSTRQESPLRQAEDAIRIDSTDLDVDGVLQRMCAEIARRKERTDVL